MTSKAIVIAVTIQTAGVVTRMRPDKGFGLEEAIRQQAQGVPIYMNEVGLAYEFQLLCCSAPTKDGIWDADHLSIGGSVCQDRYFNPLLPESHRKRVRNARDTADDRQEIMRMQQNSHY